MELNELFDALDVESPAEFEYFEHFADLIELEHFIEYGDFYTILSEAPAELLEELSQNYFEDMLNNLPDNIVDIYTLLTSIQKCLTGLAAASYTKEGRRAFIDELYKFRSWYAEDGIVSCTNKADRKTVELPVCEALVLCRAEKLGGESYEYDFSQCLDYQLDEYSVNLGRLAVDAEYAGSAHADGEKTAAVQDIPRQHSCFDCSDEEEDCHCGAHHRHEPDLYERDDEEDYRAEDEEAYTAGLVDRFHPVIDGEFSDDEEF